MTRPGIQPQSSRPLVSLVQGQKYEVPHEKLTDNSLLV